MKFVDPFGREKKIYLNVINDVETGNTIIGFAGLGVTGIGLIPGLQALIPVGITMMGTTGVINVGLGASETYVTGSPEPFIISGISLVVSTVGGSIISKSITGINVTVNSTFRLINEETGRYIANSIGKISITIKQGSTEIFSYIFENLVNNN